MDTLATKILSRLSSAYPSYMQLEACRKEVCEEPASFRRGVAYLEEKAFVELRGLTEGEADGVFGEVRATASGLDYLNKKSRRVTATFFK